MERERIPTIQRATRRFRGRAAARRGLLVIELILAFPVLFVLLLAIIEFGLILANLKHIEFASRVGAKVASEESAGTLPTAVTTVKGKVDKVLSAIGIDSCQVILEHNVPDPGCVSGGASQTLGSCAKCSTPSIALPSTTAVEGGAVRVTVCVELSEVTPDLLSSYGFSTANRAVIASTTYPYKNCNP